MNTRLEDCSVTLSHCEAQNGGNGTGAYERLQRRQSIPEAEGAKDGPKVPPHGCLPLATILLEGLELGMVGKK